MNALLLRPINDPEQSATEALRLGARKIYRALFPDERVELHWKEGGIPTSHQSTVPPTNEDILLEKDLEKSLVRQLLEHTSELGSQIHLLLDGFRDEVDLILCPKGC